MPAGPDAGHAISADMLGDSWIGVVFPSRAVTGNLLTIR